MPAGFLSRAGRLGESCRQVLRVVPAGFESRAGRLCKSCLQASTIRLEFVVGDVSDSCSGALGGLRSF